MIVFSWCFTDHVRSWCLDDDIWMDVWWMLYVVWWMFDGSLDLWMFEAMKLINSMCSSWKIQLFEGDPEVTDQWRMLRGNSIPGSFVFRCLEEIEELALSFPFLNRQRSTVQATFVIFTNPINLINLILSTSLDKFHLWAKSTTPMTRGSRNRDDDNDDTMLFRFTRSRPGDQEKSTVFFQNPEKPGEIRKSPAVFQKKNLRSLKNNKKTCANHSSKTSYLRSPKKAVFGCSRKSPLGSGMEALKSAAHRGQRNGPMARGRNPECPICSPRMRAFQDLIKIPLKVDIIWSSPMKIIENHLSYFETRKFAHAFHHHSTWWNSTQSDRAMQSSTWQSPCLKDSVYTVTKWASR